jgi:hypothetical protein
MLRGITIAGLAKRRIAACGTLTFHPDSRIDFYDFSSLSAGNPAVVDHCLSPR